MTIEPYNYNDEPSGRTDTLIQALEKIERLEKQLEIAVEALNTAINIACPYGKSLNDMFDSMKTIQKKCGIALQQIKEDKTMEIEVGNIYERQNSTIGSNRRVTVVAKCSDGDDVIHLQYIDDYDCIHEEVTVASVIRKNYKYLGKNNLKLKDLFEIKELEK